MIRNMRKFLIFITMAAAMSIACINLSAKKPQSLIETPGSDPRIEYTGRTLVNGNDVSYDWSGVYVRVKFNGPYLAMKCSDTKNSWFNLWVDKEMGPEADKKFIISAKDTTIVLAEGLGKGEHYIILQKRTEAEQGRMTIHSFLSEGEIIAANGRKQRHIEFIGDSYTCGYGTESASRNDPFQPETENCNLTYAAIASRYFDADFSLISHSGQGIARNYDNFGPGYYMPDRYNQTFDIEKEPIWQPKSGAYTPDVVVIYLGTNDFSCGAQPHEASYRNNYITLLKKIKENYGAQTPILCMGSPANPYMYDYIRSAVVTSELENVAFMTVSSFAHNNEDDLGASWHPNYQGHIKVASCMIPYISTLTGWKMEEKAYK
jgi:lysophospholipase L1-like esterase